MPDFLEKIARRAGAPDLPSWLSRWAPRAHRVALPAGRPVDVEEGDRVTLLGRVEGPWTVTPTRGRIAFVGAPLRIGRNQRVQARLIVPKARAQGIARAYAQQYPGNRWMLATGSVEFFGADGVALALSDGFPVPLPQDRIAEAIRRGDRFVAPVYPLVSGAEQWRVRGEVARLLRRSMPSSRIPQDLQALLESRGLPGYREALGCLHGFLPIPGEWAESFAAGASPAHRRLAAESVWEMLNSGKARSRRSAAVRIQSDPAELYAVAPFELTGDQKRAVAQTLAGLGGEDAMRRLVQGDVGSGKSMVAFLSALAAARAGAQVALMAPTEILATQLHEGMAEVVRWAGDLVPVCFLSGSSRAAERRKAVALCEGGHPGIVVGTHAVAGLPFARLGLVVIDEEQRFGLEVKERLLSGGAHCLSMSATPIPRSLAAAMHGGAQVSVIAEKPPGRKPVETRLVLSREEKRGMIEAMKEAFAQGRQAFVVCPSIDGDETISVNRVAGGLKKIFGDRKVLVAHGDLPQDEMARVLERFREGRAPCLVATSVIEVGINVPNATIMVIADPQQFGLSQLHQIRGRVGRGEHAARCYLSPLKELGVESRARLEFFASTEDGFRIAEYDLRARGAGDLRTCAQSGHGGINLLDHGDLVEWMQEYLEDRRPRPAVEATASAIDELQLAF